MREEQYTDMRGREIKARIGLVTVFGIAFGWLEAVVVVYIRRILEAERTIDLTNIVVEQADATVMFIERTREAATIVMLACLALLAFRNWRRRIAAFLLVFAVWDIFYYVTLKILIKWPPSFATIDCLFLIPRPWIAPVWFPLLASLGMLVAAGLLFREGAAHRTTKR